MSDIPPDALRELGECFTDLSPQVLRYARYQIPGDDALAEDLMMQAFEEAHKRWSELRTRCRSEQAAWLRLAVKRDAIDLARREKIVRDRLSEVFRLLSQDESDPFETVNRLLLIDRFNAVVAQMPERRREVALLKWHQGKRNMEIALILGISEKTVSSHLAAARSELLRVVQAATAEETCDREGGGYR